MSVHLLQSWQPSTALDRGVQAVLQWGWAGVDLFFVLSGFLITGILVDARSRIDAQFSAYWGRFMWRRALRIFPLYYAALVVIFVFLPASGIIHDPAYQQLFDGQKWYWTYTVNVFQSLHPHPPGRTGHFWSLAVEEQFYLVWPLLIWWFAPRRLEWLCVSLWVAAVAGRIICVLTGHTAGVYVLTPLRLDPLMGGALVALAVRSWPATRLRALALAMAPVAILGLLMLRGIHGTINSDDAYVQMIGYPLLAVVGAAGLALVVTSATAGRGRLARHAAHRSLRFFGMYSYCLYVVHYPLMMAIDRLPWSTVPTIGGSTLPALIAYGAVLFGTSIMAAMVSWRLLERPMLRLKDRPPRLRRRASAVPEAETA